MADLKHVRSGDPLKIQAGTWNAILDAARAHRESRLGGGARAGGREARGGNLISVRNDTGEAVAQGAVLAVGDPLILPSASEAGFLQRILVTGTVPTTSTGPAFVVTAQPIAPGQIGPAYAAGVCPAQVNVTDTGHTCAAPADGVTGHLVSSPSGPVTLLWTSGTTGLQWALVRFGGQAADAPACQLRVRTVDDDHLVCRSFDGTVEGSVDIWVAKPYHLRRSVYDGTTTGSGWLLTYSNASQRIASKSGEASLTHQIDPPYADRDLIYAVQPVGGTSVSYLGTDVIYQDLNVDCRRWAFGC